MSFEILVPSLPESVSDATLVTWHKQAGEWVNEGDNLADLETDKVILEVPAPKSGTLLELVVQDGETVVGGQLLAKLDAQQAKPAQVTEKAEEAVLSPSVRKLVAEKDLDPQAIAGSGKHGRILKTDVLDFLNTQAKDAPPAPTPAPAPATETHSPLSATAVASLRPEQRVPMTRLRAKVAERLLQAQQNAAMLTTFNEVNLSAVIDLRNHYKDRFETKHSIKLGFMSFFVKASIEGLKRFPAINASIDGSDIIYHGYYDIGIAVTTPRGLIVPILRDADQLDFAGIEKGIHDFGNKARNGSISVEDLSGGTFTITNGGIFGSMLSTPILNPPQCAILGMHAIKDRPVVENGEIVIRPIMYLALSYDHRLIDGKEAVQFLGIIKECLEAPAHLLLNI
ncbi:2-oxoglutarate dehydrogenase complex dihydrolipoyllysine-residue succinyltransferase [Methylomonas fluvii]|uniref:Dihydrolipoyllysine-residue succinyltransferase component of 2-oxoglutarate dehydrogenase complex n=1 Tax=Methylomonas fluvii TaxID=1854564 RepID=A0ABR9DJK0_9GAMM|nr:2-oxoglutarate dehydrogenase complex dihydrolipoyllysine-residue succinyltransferase [Methylomonas fluvii]MBD9363270.1 2-oxoglutarate dehydrogenase complex dihydrolipoyllysine-residue succinyltransferase [Methylomonas fluvii]CAD6876527.1 Dihydrolipoamide succinyltransferase component (E2) of 2-oxoglutarate dehydrogenase complex (EC 2.3.1.61) [Methylomonas fluvii]